MNNNEEKPLDNEEVKKEKHHDKHHEDKNEKIKELNDKIEALTSEIIRNKADMINYRKRKDEETANMLKYASSDLISSILMVKDNFDRALNLNEEKLSPEIKNFLSGFKMIQTQLAEVLKNFGVSEINPLGEKFDSNKENCLFTESNPDIEDEVVLEVLTKGYTYNDKILRCAQVKVNKNEKQINDKENE